MFVCSCLLTPTPIPPIIRQNKNCITGQSPLFFFLCTLLYFICISGPMEKQLWRVWSVSSLFTACIFHCTSRCFSFFSFLRYLLIHVLNFFFLMELYFEKGKYFCPGIFVGWQLQNKLFNKPGLLTGSSGQIFQIELNYCSSAFFHLSASWTLFWSWMPDKQLCHEKIYVSNDILVSPPTSPHPLRKDPAWGLHIYQVWLEILSVLSGTSFDQVARVYRLFRGSDSCTFSAYRCFTTMHMVLIIVHFSFCPFFIGVGGRGEGVIRKITLITNFWLNKNYYWQPVACMPAARMPAARMPAK